MGSNCTARLVYLRLHIVTSTPSQCCYDSTKKKRYGLWLCAVAGVWLYAGGKKRYTPGKICGGCLRTKSDAPRRVPNSLPEKAHDAERQRSLSLL